MPSPANNPTVSVRKPRRSRGGYLLVLLLWVIALGLVAMHRQDIYDWWQLRDYHAPATIAALADQDTLTGYGRKIFYVNHPQIDSKSSFSQVCPNNGGEQTIVLGCYHSGQSGIFLLSVNDPRLDGVVQVTAAHEMLHGAYERLSTSDREKVDAMLLDYYNHDLHDPRILKTIAAYKKSEPDAVVDEMHSVFGTEVAQLPSGLEAYYKRYFDDRSRVTAYANQYQNEFTSRESIVAADDAKLEELKTRITSLEADLSSKHDQISAMQDRLARLKDSGDTSAYNAGVPEYNNAVSSYNAEVQTVKNLISQYNQLVAERNAVALEEDQLVKDLSSPAAPIR